jgi:predicted dehydrogenase
MELFARKDLNGVLILTHPDSSSTLLQQALRSHKRIFVEKPVAYTRAQIEGCAVIADEREAIVQVGYNRRFQPLSRELARQLAAMGPDVHVRSQFWRAAREEPRFFDDTLVHCLDLLSHLLGRLQVKDVRTWQADKDASELDRGWRVDLSTGGGRHSTAEIDIRPAVGRDEETLEVLGHKRGLSLRYPHPGRTDVYARLLIHEDGASRVFHDSYIPGSDTVSRCYHSGFVNQVAEFALLCSGAQTATGCQLDGAADVLRLRDEIAKLRTDAHVLM